jgi:hypothetical protein
MSFRGARTFFCAQQGKVLVLFLRRAFELGNVARSTQQSRASVICISGTKESVCYRVTLGDERMSSDFRLQVTI